MTLLAVVTVEQRDIEMLLQHAEQEAFDAADFPQDRRLDVAGVDARGLQRVALQVQRLEPFAFETRA